MVAPVYRMASLPVIVHLNPLATIGGCEVNCLRVIEGLPGYRHWVLVFDEPGPMSAKWEAAGAQVEHLKAWNQGVKAFELTLAGWARDRAEPSGVFYWSTSRLPAVLKGLVNWRTRFAIYVGNPVTGKLVRQLRLFAQELVSRAPAEVTLVACSEHVAASHRSAYYFRRFATETIYNAVGPAFDRPRTYRALPVGSMPRVGMVARLDSIKDHLTVIRALAVCATKRSDIIVEFAGEGDLRDLLVGESLRLGVAGRVRFLGSVSDVAGLIKDWDVYVHSTTESEGMGTAVAEAMMSGLPCVVSDIGVMREVCGENGAIYAAAGDAAKLGECLVNLIDDRGLRESLGATAQNRARRLFGCSEVAAAYSRVVSPGCEKGGK